MSNVLSLRPLKIIAKEIRSDWKKVSPYAESYLAAMETIESINDNYLCDSGSSVVAYFIANAKSWNGPNARRIKKELNNILDRHYRSIGIRK